MKNNQLKIKFTIGAFDKALERAGFETSRHFTKQVDVMNKTATVLDRFDEFGSLTLPPNAYAESGEYGISQKKGLHFGSERILPHQVKATLAFLKELRGFGLLADVVGSGKTYEACSVISELSAKGKIATALLVVPSQVYDTWVEVLERQFGLGIGVLKRMGKNLDQDLLDMGQDGLLRPQAPIIVTTEDFVKWREHEVENVLFDVVIVDEAHKLCAEEGENAKALKLLSVMMMAKKKAKKTYCVLLSATPHEGNLEQMFRLWYFIRCKGGLPQDFDVKTDEERTLDYRKEKEYYKNHICRGATTVMEFINNVKMAEVTQNFGALFDEFLRKNNVVNFHSLLEGEKKNLVERFLEQNEKIAEKVINNVANAYHNGVLRSIMIRQPNDRIRKGKRIENYFFFPANKAEEKCVMKGLQEEPICFFPNQFNTDRAIQSQSGNFYSIDGYVSQEKGNLTYKSAYGTMFFDGRILQAYGLTEDKFKKDGSLGFYWEQLRSGLERGKGKNQLASDEDVHLSFLPVYGKMDSYRANVYNQKLSTLKELLRKNADNRVIVFFDYNTKREDVCFDKVLAELQADKNFSARLIVATATEKDATIQKFNDKKNAILFVTDSAFTEGANLQKCNVIVNFQVTPNPLAMEQSIGRIFRLGQENDVTIYSFADMTDLEGYVLMYFTRIGLMTSNDGDAAIIAGCNNDKMVTIRCQACGNVKLMSRDEYDEYKKKGSAEIYCSDNAVCTQKSPKGMLMVEINSNELKCDNCNNVIRRKNSGDGGQFHCISTSSYGSGVMCSKGDKGDRTYYCRKICAIAHCNRFISGAMKDKCVALAYYKTHPNATDTDFGELCDGCQNADMCWDKCKIGQFESSIASCSTCDHATCLPKPHAIHFDDDWIAECPSCGNGRLRPVVARTFETYVRSAFDYDQDGGKSFCKNLSRECSKVAQIKQILSNDKASDDNE